jgi:GT2 family glycosyltransferase
VTAWHVTVVVVTHQGQGERIERCLTSLHRAGGCDAVVVVDNSPGAIEGDDPLSAYGPGVGSVVTMPNRGYGAAANAGFAWARSHAPRDLCSAVVLLNDDVTVRSGWLPPLLEVFDADSSVGAVQPKIVFAEDGSVNSAGVELDRYHAGADVGFGADDGPTWTGTVRIDAFSGGAVAFRGEFLDDTGGFDERFFLYYEDVDLSLRGRARGWRLACQRDAVVEHDFGASTVEMGAARRRMQERNRLWVAARHAPPRVVADALWLSVRRLAHPPRRAHAMALLTGAAGMPPRLLQRCREGRS